MKKLVLLILLFAVVGLAQARKSQQRILIFTKTTRYYHESIPAGVAAIMQLGAKAGIKVDTTSNSANFNVQNLRRYAAVVFLSTSGNLLDSVQKLAFMQYLRAGGGYMGIHSASASEKEWDWYGKLVGAVFTDHPEPQEGYVIVADSLDQSTSQLPRHWKHMDEWYNFKKIPSNVHVLLCADESSYKGGKNGAYHPLAWYHAYDGGRAFYTALGHFAESWSDPLFLQHVWAGIRYTMGNPKTR